MADTISFKDAVGRSEEYPQTLEEAIMKAAAYSGIHSFDFQNTIDEDFSSLSDWEADGSGTFSVSGNQLSATGGGTPAIAYTIRHTTQVPPSFVASFDYVSGTGGFYFRGKDEDLPASGYLLSWSSTAAAASRLDGSGGVTLLSSIPGGISAPARLQVCVRYGLSSYDEDRKWVEMSLWYDGYCRLCFAESIGGTAYDWNGDYIGFTAIGSDNLVVDNFTVQELHRRVEWITIDPGQDPGSGMARAVGSSRVVYFCRFDNTFRVWRPGNRNADWEPDDSRHIRIDERYDPTRSSHVRVQGAIHEADAFVDTELQAHMHRFLLHNDPNVESELETYREAYRVSHDEREMARVARFETPPQFLIEPYDRITVDGRDWRVVAINTQIEMQGSKPVVTQQIEAQQYLGYTEPSWVPGSGLTVVTADQNYFENLYYETLYWENSYF